GAVGHTARAGHAARMSTLALERVIVAGDGQVSWLAYTGRKRSEGAMSLITTVEELEALYGQPAEASLIKEVDHVTPQYQALISASPFAVLATSGPEGLDCSPRGDQPGFVHVVDPKTLMLPDRRGNNRTDSLRNIIRDPR